MYEGPVLANHTRDAIRQFASSGLAVIPVGAIEQHGPHLPICTDTEIVTRVCLAAAETPANRGKVFVAPTVQYGLSHHHLPQPGVMTVEVETLLGLLRDLSNSLVRSGFKQIMIANAHGGNKEIIGLLAREANFAHNVTTFAVHIAQLPTGDVSAPPGHAGELETSLMMFLTPDLVSDVTPPDSDLTRRFVNGTRLHLARTRTGQTCGYTDSPAKATSEKGEIIFTAWVDALATIYEQVRAAHHGDA